MMSENKNNNWIESALEEVDKYFENATKEQIEKDLKKAGYYRYKDLDYPNISNYKCNE